MSISHRKVNKVLVLTDKNGAPIANKDVHIRQTNHSFLFGCGAFDFIPHVMNGDDRTKEITEMYRILFSHPLVEAITTWDFKDGAWLNAPSGFLRKDLSKKPSYEMLKKLVKDEWWTDITVKTDDQEMVIKLG